MVEVTIEHLENGEWKPQTIKLDIDADMALTEETLDQDMCELPRKISQYAEVSAELHAMAARKKNDVEVVEAEVAIDVRRKFAVSGDKITEPGIKEIVVVSPVVTAARNAFYHTDAEFRKVDGFYRSLREKASLSIALCYKLKAEITAISSSLN